MRRPVRRDKSIAVYLSWIIVALLSCGPVTASTWAGRPLADALKSLNQRDFAIIFSTQLVPDGARVTVEAQASDAYGIASQWLAPFGLRLQRVARGLFAVVPLPPSNQGESPDTLRQQAVPLDEVVVAASRYTVVGSDFGVYGIKTNLSAAEPTLADDALRVVQRLPGVANNGVSAQINVRGGDTDEVLVLMDGFPVRQALHVPAFQSPFSAFDATAVSGIDVYTGGFPVRYGNRMSGVIDVASLDPDQAPRHSLSASSFHLGARTAGSLSALHRVDGLVNWRAGTLRSFIDRIAPDVLFPLYTDGMAKLRWRPNDASIISAHALWSRDSVAVRDADRGESARLQSRAIYAWLQADHQFSAQWRGQAWLGYSDLQSQRTGQVDNADVVRGDVDDNRVAALWDLRWRMVGILNEQQQLELGGDWHMGDADYRYLSHVNFAPSIAALYGRPNAVSRDVLVSPFRRDFSAFAAYRIRIGDSLTTEWGLRAQRATGINLSNQVLWDPRAMLSWDIGAKTRLRASWGRFHQADDVQELRIADGALGFAPSQYSDHSILALEHADRWGIQWRIEAFRKSQANPRPRFENLLNPLAILAELSPDRVLLAPDRAELRGLEVSAAYQRDHWAWHIGYTWSGADDSKQGIDFVRGWDQTHAFSGAAQWRRGRWTAGAAISVHTGWPTTPLLRNTNDELTIGVRNSRRWPTYASLDMRVGYRLPLTRGELLFAIDLTNVLDRRNRCCSELIARSSSDGTSVAAEPLSLLPVTPIFLVRWNF